MTMTPSEKAETIQTLQRALNIVQQIETATPCCRCDNWTGDNDCSKWGDVPEDVRPGGCPDFVDTVPF